MADLSSYLYDYLSDKTYSVLKAQQEYQQASAAADSAQEVLLAALTEDQRELFFQFLERNTFQSALEEEYMVREALALPVRTIPVESIGKHSPAG